MSDNSKKKEFTPRDSEGGNWPDIKEDGVTWRGFGNIYGELPCFITEYRECIVHLRKSLVNDLKTAQNVFEQLLPTLDEMWPNCDDSIVEIEINEEKQTLFLYFSFSHINIMTMVEKRKHYVGDEPKTLL